MRSETSPRRKIFGLHPNVFFLGLVSFFTDASSELTMTILPLFLANVLGVGPAIIGLIEGVAESTATILKVVSGWLSDRLGRRKPLAVLGYSLSTLAKPFLYLAGAWPLVLAVRFTDRLGKGIRTSPRDALVADSSSQADRGKSFGFHRALDSLGAVLGLAVAAAIVYGGQRGALELTRETYQKLVPVGVAPAVVAVLLLLLFVREVRGARKRQEPPGVDRLAPARTLNGLWGPVQGVPGHHRGLHPGQLLRCLSHPQGPEPGHLDLQYPAPAGDV